MKQVTAKQASKDTTHDRFWLSRRTGEYEKIKAIQKWGPNVMITLDNPARQTTLPNLSADEFVTDPGTLVYIGKLLKDGK